MNFRLVSRLLSRLFGGMALAMLAAIPWTWGAPDSGGVEGLLGGAGITAAVALSLGWFGRNAETTMRIRDALFVVTAGWFSAGLLGAVPYLWSGAITHPADALFETLSGFTTTGSTILSDIEALPIGIQFWRISTHWLGGLGIVVIFVALFPQLGVGAKHLFKSEVPGPITEGLRPKIKQTALALWWIYVGLTGLETLLLWACGLSPFDALAHAMSNIATGGFSTKNASIGHFADPRVEYIVCLFMYLAGINFALHYAALSGRLRSYLRDAEWRYYTGLLISATLIIALLITPLHSGDFETAWRKALFHVLALLTSTGFAAGDFELWPVLCQVMLITLIFIGGSAGSTAGGMKVSRVVILLKSAAIEIAHAAKPHAVKIVKLGRTPIRDDVVKQVLAFSVIFVCTVLLCTFWLTATGEDLLTAFTASLACVGNVGPGFGDVGPTEHFAQLTSSAKVVLSIAMVLGRLEFFTVLAILLPAGWRR
ncbi:MAG: TrkH family potassium uptake protein [Myxococcota bacterium]